jgi:gas vesicle protein
MKNNNLFAGIIFGVALGAIAGYFYRENKKTVDTRIQKAIKDLRKETEHRFADAKNVTTDTLETSGKTISNWGSKLSKVLAEKADEIGRKADEIGKSNAK